MSGFFSNGALAALKSVLATAVGGAMVATAAQGVGAELRTVESKLRDTVSVTDFMTSAQRTNAYLRIGTLDVTAAIQATIAAAALAGGGRVYFPDGVYLVSSTINISSPGVYLVGAGMWKAVIKRTADYGDTFFFTGNDATGADLLDVGICDMSMESAGLTTAGAHIHMNGVARADIHGLHIQHGFIGMKLNGLTAAYIDKIYMVFTDIFGGSAAGRRFMSFGNSGVNYSHRSCGDVFISNFNLRGNTASHVTEAGIYMASGDGIWFSNGHIGNTTVANIILSAETAQIFNLVFFNNVMSDEGLGYSLLFQGSDTSGRSIQFTNCNFKGGATTNYGIACSTTATFYGVTFTNCWSWEHGNHGVFIQSPNFRDIRFTNCTVRGNGMVTAASAGYAIANSCRDITVIGGTAGGDNDDPAITAPAQAYGVSVGSSTVGVVFDSVDLRNNGTASITGGFGANFTNCLSQDSVSVASAATLSLPNAGKFFTITGTTQIDNIQVSQAGREVVLSFAGNLTVTDAGNKILAGQFVTTADDTLSLIFDGTNWRETARSVN